MKLTIAEPRLLKDSVSIISDLVSEARFKVTPDGLELVAMDPANVAMVIFKLFSSAFVEYNIDESVSNIAINLSNLKQILRRANPTDALTLEVNEGMLQITLQSNQKRTFQLPLIDFDEREQKVPDLEFGSKVTTYSAIFNSAIEDVDIVGESVSLGTKTELFSISASGDLSKAHVDIHADEETKIESKEDTQAKYSIEYIKKMMQSSKLASQVVIQFNKDYPLKLEYSSVNKLLLAFILAPRVDS